MCAGIHASLDRGEAREPASKALGSKQKSSSRSSVWLMLGSRANFKGNGRKECDWLIVTEMALDQ